MRILEIYARDFLSFDSLNLKLDPGLNVIVGPNGSGKTNLVRLLRMAADTCLGDRDRWQGAKRGKPLVADGNFEVHLSLQLDTQRERILLASFMRGVVLNAIPEYPESTGQASHRPPTLKTRQPAEDVEAKLAIDRRDGRWNIRIELKSENSQVSWEDWARTLLSDPAATRRMIQFLNEIYGMELIETNYKQFYVSSDSEIYNFLRQFQIDNVALSYKRLTKEHPADPSFVWQVHADLLRPLGLKLKPNYVITLGAVLGRLLQRGIQIADNIRLPYRKTSWHREALGRPIRAFDLRNGKDLPIYLLRLQHGDPEERDRFEKIREIFRELTGHSFHIRLDSQRQVAITLEEEFGDIPLEFDSAGHWEALILSAMIAEEERVLVLDEPALNLHPNLQRRILKQLRERKGQTILITHSPHMVPAEDVEDLRRIVRFQKEGGATRLGRLEKPETAWEAQKLLLILRRSTDMAALLFARGVILTEGKTECGALPVWWGKSEKVKKIGGPEEWNLVIQWVGGHQGFKLLVRLLNAWRIPWGAVVDGEHLRAVMKSLREMHQEDENTIDRMGFEELKEWAESLGVFTLNRSEKGEDGRANFETLPFVRPHLEEAGQEIGNNKILQGWWIAQHTDTPKEVEELYEKIVKHLGIW